MANAKVTHKAGQGGGLGHSNMSHWTGTEEVKVAARKRGRVAAKRSVEEVLLEGIEADWNYATGRPDGKE
jgi:hypothetical protein